VTPAPEGTRVTAQIRPSAGTVALGLFFVIVTAGVYWTDVNDPPQSRRLVALLVFLPWAIAAATSYRFTTAWREGLLALVREAVAEGRQHHMAPTT
jgi:hypothetical protein